LFERFLAISIRNEGSDGINTAAGNTNLCNFQQDLADGQLITDKRKEHLCLAESYMKEALRISTKVHGSANSRTIHFAAKLLAINRRLLMV
jgi:hypothetical protein